MSVRPLVIGDIENASKVFVFESQWDMFAFADQMQAHETDGYALVAARGASNGIKGVAPKNTKTFAAILQNDKAGQDWLEKIVKSTEKDVLPIKIPPKHKDLNEWVQARATTEDIVNAINQGVDRHQGAALKGYCESIADNRLVLKAGGIEQWLAMSDEDFEVVLKEIRPEVMLAFLSPKELRNYEAPEGSLLVGDNHITRGEVFLIGGAPSVGKSRAATALAVAGATGNNWFNHQVHSRFKTMIIQNENGERRLKSEYSEISSDVDDWVKVSPPPPYGLLFEDPHFRDQLSAEIARFGPGVIIIDPWNAAAKDDKQKDYREMFDLIKSCLPKGEKAPALGIVAHTRKPKPDERASGSALLHLFAGSYILGSVPRAAFVIQSASDDVEETQIVFTCCKNNNGERGPRSAWTRRDGLFTPVSGFDWESFDNQGRRKKDKNENVERVAQILRDNGPMAQGGIMKESGMSQSTVSRAVTDGYKSGLLKESHGLISLSDGDDADE